MLDLERLHDFLVDKSPRAAQNVRRTLSQAPEQFGEREVRRIVVGDYEIRYEIVSETIWILQLWHGKEDR
jgi:plasmid stabilization system protein ParE